MCSQCLISLHRDSQLKPLSGNTTVGSSSEQLMITALSEEMTSMKTLAKLVQSVKRAGQGKDRAGRAGQKARSTHLVEELLF